MFSARREAMMTSTTHGPAKLVPSLDPTSFRSRNSVFPVSPFFINGLKSLFHFVSQLYLNYLDECSDALEQDESRVIGFEVLVELICGVAMER